MTQWFGQANEARASGLLTRLADWWSARSELSAMPPEDVHRIAHDIGIGADDLRALAARGPGAADLLYERMAVMGLSRADVDRLAPGLMRDLETCCSCCSHKEQCGKELAVEPEAPGWMTYCANMTALLSLETAKGRAMI
jgi:hypothetical protein